MLCLLFFPLPEDKQRKVGFFLLLSDLNITLLMPGKTPKWTDRITRIYLTEGSEETCACSDISISFLVAPVFAFSLILHVPTCSPGTAYI